MSVKHPKYAFGFTYVHVTTSEEFYDIVNFGPNCFDYL